MSELVKTKTENQISFISMDDGKANAMSVEMLEGLNAALDEAEQSGSVVILSGRENVLSGGFDLGVFKSGDNAKILKMLTLGAELSHRMLSYPKPVIAACTGHAVSYTHLTLPTKRIV